MTQCELTARQKRICQLTHQTEQSLFLPQYLSLPPATAQQVHILPHILRRCLHPPPLRSVRCEKQLLWT